MVELHSICLGPLTNPAMVKNQLIGVFSEDYQERIVKILQRKNAETIMAVRSADGMDELSTTSKNQICMLKNDTITKTTSRSSGESDCKKVTFLTYK